MESEPLACGEVKDLGLEKVQKMSLISLVDPPYLSKKHQQNGKFRYILRSLLFNTAGYVYC